MEGYGEKDVLRLARRLNNPKRSYLLVDPLQGKHIPVSPGRALDMMTALGRRLAEAYPETRLVIGFAETATAVAAAAAGCLGPETVLLQTTREDLPGPWLGFREEHSHAVEQRLSAAGLADRIAAAGTVAFVDDEFSTGRTLRNVARRLREEVPALADCRAVAAAVVDRLSPDRLAGLAEEGIECLSLVRPAPADFEALVRDWPVRPAEELPRPAAGRPWFRPALTVRPGDPRLGVSAAGYGADCRRLAEELLEQVRDRLPPAGSLLVLGTEECMYPALVLGRLLEETFPAARVLCHATTRSPIGVWDAPGYPIRNGVRLESFYDPARTTYLYDLTACDAALVVSDAPAPSEGALAGLAAALDRLGRPELIYAGV